MEKQNSTLTIKTRWLESAVNEKGRVRAGDKLFLDVSRIRRIFAYGGNYYIEYETDKTDYYRQYIEAPPPLAVELKHRVEEYKVDVCDKCGSQIEWDADEPFCPRGCDERYDDWSYHTETRRRFVVESSVFDEVEQFIEKAFGVKAEFVDDLFRNMAGGYAPQFKLLEIDVTLREAHLTGLAVVENPVFVYSDYDSVDTSERRYDGKYIVAEVYAGGFHRLLFKYEGEPDLSALQRLHEEYLAKKLEEERRRRAEEEMERRRKEEEEKWGDPAKVVEAIRAALPEWADGAVVVARSVCDEDCDVYYYVYPVKRSSKRAGEYYTSREWRQLKLEVPDRFLEKLASHIITSDGSAVKVKEEKEAGRYLNLRVV